MPIDDSYMTNTTGSQPVSDLLRSYLEGVGVAPIRPWEDFSYTPADTGSCYEERVRELERMVQKLSDKVSDLIIMIKEVASGKSIDEIDIDDLMRL